MNSFITGLFSPPSASRGDRFSPTGSPPFLLGVVQQHKMAIAAIEGLVEFPESLPVNFPRLLRVRIVVPGKLVVGNLNGFDDRPIFVPLLLLAGGGITINQVAQINEQGRFQPVDFHDQAFEWQETLTLETRTRVADYGKFNFRAQAGTASNSTTIRAATRALRSRAESNRPGCIRPNRSCYRPPEESMVKMQRSPSPEEREL